MMTRRVKLSALVSSLSAGLFGTACASDVKGHPALSGRWGAVLGVGPAALRLVLEIAPDKPVILISIDQNGARIPATSGSTTPTALDLQFASVRGQLTATLDPQGLLVGSWSQGRAQPITFSKLAEGQLPVAAAPEPFGDLQDELNAERLKSNAPAMGAAFMRSKQGQLVSGESVAGVLAEGSTRPVSASVGLKWHIGSITKSMTATLVARLVEQGLIAWDMKLKDAFGEIAPDMLVAYRDVTLAQLMTGRSGMPTNVGTAALFGHATSEETPTARRKVWAQQALSMPPENAPGAGFVYPNNGYVLAGALCEKVTGQSYEILMVQEVFSPLGMRSAGFGPPLGANPQGHRRAILGGRIMPVGLGPEADNPAAMSPAGRAHMTLLDLAKFGLAHSNGHQGLRNNYLKQETWKFLHTPPVRTPNGNDYAFGLVARRDGTLWHNGSNTYWMAEMAFDPAKRTSACACANFADTADAVSRLLAVGLAKAEAAS